MITVFLTVAGVAIGLIILGMGTAMVSVHIPEKYKALQQQMEFVAGASIGIGMFLAFASLWIIQLS